MVGLVALMFTLSYAGRSLLPPMLLPIASEFNMNSTDALSLVLVLSVGYGFGMFSSGLLASLFRARSLVVFSIGGAGCCLILMLWAAHFWQAGCLLAVFGYIAGMYFPAGMATLSSLIESRDLGKAVSIHELAPSTSLIIAPLFASLCLGSFEWRQCFALAGLIMVLGALFFALFAQGGKNKSPRPSFSGIARLLCAPNTWVFMAFYTLLGAGIFACYTILPLYLVEERHLAPDTAYFIISLSRLITPVFVLLGGLLADRFSPRRLLGGYFILHGISLMLLTLPAFPVLVTGLVTQSMLAAASFPVLFKFLADIFPASRHSLVLGICPPLAAFIATGLLPRLLGYIGALFSFSAGFVMFGAIYVCAVLLFFVPMRNLE